MSKSKTPYIASTLRSTLAAAQAEVARFKENLDKNPAHALEWAPYGAAAKIEILTGYVAAYDRAEAGDPKFCTPEELTEQLTKIARDRLYVLACSPPRSSSQPTNLMAQERLGVWARLLDHLEGGIFQI